MLIGAQILFGAALLSAQVSGLPNVQLAGRPTTFDYYRRPSSETGWIEAVIHRIDTRGGMLTVLNRSSGRPTTLVFPVEDQTDVLGHRVGDKIKIQLFQDPGGVRVRHRDANP
ncbi:MAG: hypothetical protein KGM42_00060 [Hyphomicrobiales bacterium]|nr:hypothetical protein [Hyphomicrobiales bacterium]